MSMTVDEMRAKLLEWNPSWNVHKFTNEQVTVIYDKERNAIVQSIIKKMSQSQ